MEAPQPAWRRSVTIAIVEFSGETKSQRGTHEAPARLSLSLVLRQSRQHDPRRQTPRPRALGDHRKILVVRS